MSKDNFKQKEKKSWPVPDGGLTPGQTGRLTIRHKMTFTLVREYAKKIQSFGRR
jgi:hypothetical protein